MDMEKVIRGLQIHADGCGYRSHHCDAMECPYRYGDESCDIEEMCRDAVAILKEQEEKKGQWIPIESPTGVEAFGVKEMTVMNVRCSVCGSEEDVSFTGYKYCPRCGAKMEGR